MRTVSVFVARKTSDIFLSHTQWLLDVCSEAQSRAGTPFLTQDIEAVIVNTRDASALVKENYQEFYCQDVDRMNRHMALVHQAQALGALVVPSVAVRPDGAIVVIKKEPDVAPQPI